MVTKQTTLQAFKKSALVALVLTALLAACAPAQSPEQIQSQVQTSVAMTVQAQNQMGTSVAQTVDAQSGQQALATSTSTSIATSVVVPSITPVIIPSPTPYAVAPSSGGGGNVSAPQYACSWTEIKPRTNAFSPGDAIDVEWIITNTGSEPFGYKRDLDYVSGTKMSTFLGEQLPDLKPGDSVTVIFDANAPMQKGLYGMQFKVEGGLCWPALNIQVGKLKDP